MNRFRASWREHSKLVATAGFFVAALCFGLITEDIAIGLNSPRRWLPDLFVGTALAGWGVFALRWQRRIGALLIAAGLTWWLGNLAPWAVYLHRGLLLHATFIYPTGRTRSPAEAGLLAVGYVIACWLPLARTNAGTVLFGVSVLTLAAARLLRSQGRTKRPLRIALGAATALLAGSAGSAMIRMTAGSPNAVEPALFLYQAGVVATATILALGLRSPSLDSIADLVVEIGESRTATIRDALAKLLDDPRLELGVRDNDGRFVDAQGALIQLPGAASPRTATRIGQGARGDAVIIHDRSLLADNTLLEAVTSVTRLSTANAELIARASQQLTDLTAARRRLLSSEDQERRKLSHALGNGTDANLAAVERALTSILESSEDEQPARQAAREALDQLHMVRRDLDRIARGLHPWESSSDLEMALRTMSNRAPVPVSVTVTTLPERHEVASAIYYLCSEALANALKHASADHIEIEVTTDEGALTATVTDDGRGGAEPGKGTGLEGLIDRIAGVGGELLIESPEGVGTRLTARFSLESSA